MIPIILLYVLVVVGFLFHLIKNAPEGYEDETGFHYGKEPNRK